MSVGPMNNVGNFAGTPLAQAKADLDRAQHDAQIRDRRAASSAKADDAAGIGATDGDDKEASDRDADGRRLWERPAAGKADDAPAEPEEPPLSKDPNGDSGHSLDLTG